MKLRGAHSISVRYSLSILVAAAPCYVLAASPPFTRDRPDPADSVAGAIRSATKLLDELQVTEAGDRKQSLGAQIEEHLDVIRAADSSNPWLTYLHGRMLAQIGRQGDAIQQLRRFTATHEGRNEWHAYLLLGNLFVGEFPRLAKANYQKALALNDSEADIVLGLSKCALKLGQVDESMSLARQAVQMSPDSPAKFRMQLALVLRRSGRWDEAATEAVAALEQSKREARKTPWKIAPLLMIDSEHQFLIDVFRSRIREAIMNRDRGLQFNASRFADDHLHVAHHIRERAVNAQAIAVHEMVQALQSGVNQTAPETPISLLESYGVILAEAGRVEVAIGVFEQILSTDPENRLARQRLDSLRSASAPRAP